MIIVLINQILLAILLQKNVYNAQTISIALDFLASLHVIKQSMFANQLAEKIPSAPPPNYVINFLELAKIVKD
jgi:hypothetical protein